MGHIARDCPEKKVKDPSAGSSGGLAMTCIEVADQPELNLEENASADRRRKFYTPGLDKPVTQE